MRAEKRKRDAEEEAPIPEQSSRLNDIEVEEYLKQCVQVEPMALEEEFVRLPADIAYWNERYAVALREYLEAKTERERILGELTCDPRVADALENRLGKKPTVDQVKGAVLNAERYIAAKVRETAADVERTRLRGCVDALSTKRDMLISLGAHMRLEMMHDPIVRRNMAAMREVEAYGAAEDDDES